ncbi:hypothetical protein Scep_023285 [Stephania cephalantha]|uniref:Uncharacterized protein n=1 Tax=Stephania cephalantha TaxID=152367 RepID=A0AAP0HXF1_9MAGN
MYRRRTTASRRKAASAETVYLTIGERRHGRISSEDDDDDDDERSEKTSDRLSRSFAQVGIDVGDAEIGMFCGQVIKHPEQLKGRVNAVSGEVNFIQEEDIRLQTTRARLSNVLQRHEELKERLSRDTDKMIYARLQKEFDAARAAQTEEVYLDGEEWNDGLLATIRQRVHMEADRKAMSGDAATLPEHHFHGKTTYRVGNKVICCLEGARIGIQYETSFAGESRELYHCVLESKSFLEKITVIEHTVPFFLSIQEAVNDLLSSNAMVRNSSTMLENWSRLMLTGGSRLALSRRCMELELENFITVSLTILSSL